MAYNNEQNGAYKETIGCNTMIILSVRLGGEVMGKLTRSPYLPPRSNKLFIATSCVVGFLHPGLNKLSCDNRYRLIKHLIITLMCIIISLKRA